MDEINLSVFANRLRTRRTELGLTQVVLAERANVNQSTVSQLERGEQTPTINSVVMLTQALDISVDWLLGISDEQNLVNDERYLDEEEKQIVEIFRSVDRPYRSFLVEFLKMLIDFKRLGAGAEYNIQLLKPDGGLTKHNFAEGENKHNFAEMAKLCL